MITLMDHLTSARARHRQLRIIAMLVCGAAATAISGLLGAWVYAPAVGWTVAALIYNAWVWLKIAPMDATQTAIHAMEEDPGRNISDLLILLAALGSLAAVVLVMVGSKDVGGQGRLLLALLAMTCTAMSWLMVHTVFTLRYAEIYYSGEPGGIGFNQDEPPQYMDIAYMAFSVGMTYQVSDTNITTRAMRSAVFRHSLLAFVFGTGILATTINLVVSLAP
ncbi:putative membrane protein [Arthrobacter stackebrandtii]|uniref:Membrane protein n=1 Tax=Arthrobacter stackebrandtii TaxID=272161 RepID=A0ABS4YVB6_9MICC|nr:DUF1345 domain-containing protein [Arthrobacter stackebrandtii]MBP2412743.1 putative membrane protein [Arthrobacter stackebrandtii]